MGVEALRTIKPEDAFSKRVVPMIDVSPDDIINDDEISDDVRQDESSSKDVTSVGPNSADDVISEETKLKYEL